MSIKEGTTVKVYRNLKHGRKAKPLYSIMVNGRVVARRHRVLLAGAKFVVRERGRQRVIKEGRKNVHAFVVGTIVGMKGAFGIDHNSKRDLPARIFYNPYTGPHFMQHVTLNPTPVNSARCVLLNERGISAAYTEELR